MKNTLLSILFVAFGGCAFGQAQTQLVADCVLNFTLTDASPTSFTMNNTLKGCDNFQVTWETFGATPAATVTLQLAPSNAAGTAAGTFITFPGTPLLGTNPSTSTIGNLVIQGNAPWVRMLGAGISGTVRGQVLGCRLPCSLSSGSGGGGVTADVNIVSSIPLDVVVTSPDPLPVTQAQVCTLTANISNTGSGNIQIIPISGTSIPIICSIVVSSDTYTTLTIRYGTGTNCGTGTTTLATFPAVQGIGLDPQSNNATFPAIAGQAMCIGSSVSATIGGIVFYRYQ